MAPYDVQAVDREDTKCLWRVRFLGWTGAAAAAAPVDTRRQAQTSLTSGCVGPVVAVNESLDA
jgi:hypothetical protein